MVIRIILTIMIMEIYGYNDRFEWFSIELTGTLGDSSIPLNGGQPQHLGIICMHHNVDP